MEKIILSYGDLCFENKKCLKKSVKNIILIILSLILFQKKINVYSIIFKLNQMSNKLQEKKLIRCSWYETMVFKLLDQ
jgi:translation initiation factor IF-3